MFEKTIGLPLVHHHGCLSYFVVVALVFLSHPWRQGWDCGGFSTFLNVVFHFSMILAALLPLS
jgi:hypothetical protein